MKEKNNFKHLLWLFPFLCTTDLLFLFIVNNLYNDELIFSLNNIFNSSFLSFVLISSILYTTNLSDMLDELIEYYNEDFLDEDIITLTKIPSAAALLLPEEDLLPFDKLFFDV